MNRIENEKIAESAKKVLELLNSRDLEGDVFAVETESIIHEIEKGEISDSVTKEESGIGIRVIRGDKIGFGYTSPGREKEGVDKAEELTPLSEKLEINLPRTEDLPSVETFDEEVNERIKSEEGIDLAIEIIDGCKSVSDDIIPSRGEVSLISGSDILANTRGTFLKEEATMMSSNVNAMIQGERTSISASESRASRRMDIDFGKIGALAGEKVDSMRETVVPETGEGSIVLRPDALSQLLSFCMVPAFYGENVRKGKSVYEGKLGEKVAAADLEIVENETQDWGLGSGRFDDEGVESREVPIINDNGKLQNFLYNLKESVKSETKSTGNGKRSGFKSPPETGARNFVLRGKENNESELLEDSELLVDNVMGAHTANPVSGEFSVVVNPGWIVDNLEKKGRVDGVMISGNIPKMLETIELGKDYKKISFGSHAIELPSALLDGVTISAQTG